MNREQIAYERGYRVTKEGQLIGLSNKVVGCDNSKGYEKIHICINKKYKNLLTHRLQAYQKYGNKLYEDGIMVRHLNGNSLDNSWGNIAIGTRRDNAMDIPIEIRTKMSIQRAKSNIKYPKKFVLKLREDYKVIKNYAELGRKYNIPTAIIWSLINKRKVFKDA